MKKKITVQHGFTVMDKRVVVICSFIVTEENVKKMKGKEKYGKKEK